MRLSRYLVRESERIPRWYGLSYYEFETASAIAHPIPFNLIVRLARRVYHVVRAGMWERDLQNAYSKGFDKGFDAGRTTKS
jgi:hypothetical protein